MRWASGALLGGMPAVTLLVTVLIGTEAAAPGLLPRIGRLVLVPALLAILLFSTGSLPLQLLGFLVVGAVLAPITPAFVLLGLRLPEDLRASCFSLVSGMVTAFQVVLTLAVAALAEASTPVTAAAACCAIPLLVAAAHLAMPVRAAGQAATDPVGAGSGPPRTGPRWRRRRNGRRPHRPATSVPAEPSPQPARPPATARRVPSEPGPR